MAAATAQDDEFDSLYDDQTFDEESLAQAELQATQGARGSAAPHDGHANGSSTAAASALQRKRSVGQVNQQQRSTLPLNKRPKLVLSQEAPRSVAVPLRPAHHDDYDEETPEVIWDDDKGYIRVPPHRSPPRQPAQQRQQPHQRPQQQKRPPGPDDYHISHRGPGRPPALGAGHGESVPHDLWSDEQDWGEGDVAELHKAEEAAMLRLSQQAPRSPTKPESAEPRRRNGDSASLPAQRNGETSKGVSHHSNGRSDAPPQPRQVADSSAVDELRREKEEMQRKLQEALDQLKQRTNAMYQKDGEIKMVRQRNDKAERDLAELHLTAQRQQQDFQKKLDEQERTFAREKERLETTAAFDRIAQETSTARPFWPSSARRSRRMMGEASQPAHATTQYIPPPVAPTTPTKRRNGAMPPPTSSAHGSPSRLRQERGDDFELSPSRRARQQQHQSLPVAQDKSTKKATPKPRSFPGFDNSFVDASSPAARQSRKAKKRKEADSGVELGEQEGQVDVDMAEIGDSTHAINEVPATKAAEGTRHEMGWADRLAQSRRNRYLWAVSWFTRKRTGFAAPLLGHNSPQPLAPLSLPASRYLSAPVTSPSLVPDHSATIHRLLDTQVPAGAVDAIKERQRAATELLLTTVTNSASSSDGERRFAFLTKTDAAESPPHDEASFIAMEETDYWDCEESANEGMEDLYEDLAVSLRTLMAVYLRLCMMDALQDTTALMAAVCISHPAFVNSLVSPDLPYELEVSAVSSSQWRPRSAPLPTRLNTCLIETMRKASRVLPLAISSPASLVTEAETVLPSTATVRAAASQVRRAKQQQREQEEAAKKQPWDMGSAQREAALVSMLDLLEVLAYHLGSEAGRHLKEVFDAPGFIPTFLDARRPAPTMRRFVRLLVRLCHHADLWKTLVACRFDPALQSSSSSLPSLITKSPTPLLELLGKHLVDLKGKQKPSQAHGLHVAVVTLLTQLIVTHGDALLLARDSKTVLAALVQSIYADSNLIWNDDGHGIGARDNRAEDICHRLVIDTRLLFYLYASPTSSASDAPGSPTGIGEGSNLLMERLHAHESHLLLNGIRHCFVLALSRLAFAEEPPWLPQDCVTELQGVAELSSDLVEMILSPEEVDAAWEVCAAGDEDGGEEDEEYDGGQGGRTAVEDGEDEEMMELAGRHG